MVIELISLLIRPSLKISKLHAAPGFIFILKTGMGLPKTGVSFYREVSHIDPGDRYVNSGFGSMTCSLLRYRRGW